MVAKSFQSMKQLCEPFMENGRMYVNVKNEKTGSVRKVRWYTEAEYAKMYGEKVESTPSGFKCQKKILGFEKGYITIFKGDIDANLEWFQRSIARYCRWWGWYIVSTEEIPFDLPCGLEPIKLEWEQVGEPEGMLKPSDVIKPIIDSLLYDRTLSTFQGAVGERLNLEVTIVAVHKGENNYGTYTVHYMEDACGNRYMWKTNTKSWEIGEKKHIRGTVKEHKTFRNVDTTILQRCAEC